MCVLLHAFGVEHGVPKFLWIKGAFILVGCSSVALTAGSGPSHPFEG